MKELLCTKCETKAKPKTVTKGSMGLEVLLWLFFIVPGVLYSLWRLTSKYKACPSCGAPNMVKLDSPVAVKVLASCGGIK